MSEAPVHSVGGACPALQGYLAHKKTPIPRTTIGP